MLDFQSTIENRFVDFQIDNTRKCRQIGGRSCKASQSLLQRSPRFVRQALLVIVSRLMKKSLTAYKYYTSDLAPGHIKPRLRATLRPGPCTRGPARRRPGRGGSVKIKSQGWIIDRTWKGSFSAVSTPNFARLSKYSLESS